MGTTEVAAAKTAAEISALLVNAGAHSINAEYGEGDSIVGISFSFSIEGASVSFALPCAANEFTSYHWSVGKNRF